MASPTEIVPKTPETLPADFSGWDGDEPQETAGSGSSDFKEVSAPSVSPEPPAPRASVYSAPGPAAPASERPGNPPSLTPAAAFAEAEAFLQTFRPKYMDPEELNSWNAPSKWSQLTSEHGKKMIVAAVSVVSLILLAALIALVYPRLTGKAAASKQSFASPAATASQLKPSPSGATSKPAASQSQAAAPATADDQSADAQNTDADAQAAPPVQSEMMSSQLTAPSRIPQGIKTIPTADAPPQQGFGATGMESLNSGASNAAGNVFNGQGRPKVKAEAPKFVNVSAGVAVGLLLQRTTPIYPAIAKTARVSGTVVLQAIISKTGAIDDVQVISGPEMLRQSALTAVRNWRYKPYLLDNQPIAVETTVSVIFSLTNPPN